MITNSFQFALSCARLSNGIGKMSFALKAAGLTAVVIPVKDWPTLRDAYQQNWPQHALSYYTLSNYVEWSEKDLQMCSRDVKMYTVNEEWREHGTYILEDSSIKRCTILFETLNAENHHLVVNALRLLKPEAVYTLLYRDIVRPAVEQYLSELQIKDFSQGYCPTTLYRLPKEECLKLEVKPIAGFIIKPLVVDNVEQVNNVWPHQHPNSDYLIGRVIRHNMTLGAYDEDTGFLSAWVLFSELRTIAILQVEEAYKRRGLGEHLVRRMCLQIAEKGFDALATIMDTNAASIGLFKKLGFSAVDRVYWFDKQALSAYTETNKTFGPENSSNLKHG